MRVLKRLATILMACMLCFGLFGIVACGGGDGGNDATNYTVIVKDADGNALQGIRIGLCTYDEATEIKGACGQPKTTDANGKVVFDNAEGVWIVNSDLFSANYTAEKCVLKAYGEYTLVLTAK